MKNVYLVFLFLTACANVPVETQAVPTPIIPVTIPAKDPGKIEATCPPKGVFQAVDASEPVTQRFLDVVKFLGVTTVIRYGDIPGNETLKGKIPKLAEIDMIKKSGLKMLFVFQHNNGSIKSFTTTRGYQDATLMQLLYPNEKVWFYGVDADFVSKQDQAAVLAYAKSFKETADLHGKLVGVYGSGLTLKTLTAAGLAKYTWVAQSTGFAGTKEFSASGKWDLWQDMPRDCGGINVDFNKLQGELK